MKRFVLAIALACALSGTALAGEIHTAGLQSPQPVAGDVHSVGLQAPQPVVGEVHTAGVQAPQEPSSMVDTVILAIMSLLVS